MLVPAELVWELVVVDNNSRDDTRTVVELFARTSGLNVRYVYEGRQGHARARNRGINESRGEILAFTDDDVIVDTGWLKNIAGAFKEYDADCVGGKILPIWGKPCPKWLTKDLHGCLALLDYGETPSYLRSPEIWGANFAVKACKFKEYGSFDPNLGRIPGKWYGGEETDFIERLLQAGGRVLYSPHLIVHHFIPDDRMTKRYFRKWVFDQGELIGITFGEYRYRNVLGIPFYVIGQLLESINSFLNSSLRNKDRMFLDQLKLFRHLGFIKGRIQAKLFKHC